MKKRVTLQELADYFGVSRPTIHARLRKYNEAYKEKYDPKHIHSVFDFFYIPAKAVIHGLVKHYVAF